MTPYMEETLRWIRARYDLLKAGGKAKAGKVAVRQARGMFKHDACDWRRICSAFSKGAREARASEASERVVVSKHYHMPLFDMEGGSE